MISKSKTNDKTDPNKSDIKDQTTIIIPFKVCELGKLFPMPSIVKLKNYGQIKKIMRVRSVCL